MHTLPTSAHDTRMAWSSHSEMRADRNLVSIRVCISRLMPVFCTMSLVMSFTVCIHVYTNASIPRSLG